MIRFFNILIYTIFITVMLGVAGLLLGSMLPIPGNIEIKIVKSGSMEPAIPTGSVVVVKPSEAYRKGDIVTFGKDTERDIPTTHRIIAVAGSGAGMTYTTKGDANEEQDGTQTPARDIIGKVVFSLPYAGFILDFARQPLGFALLIGVPAGLVILEELVTIFKEARAALRRRKRGGRSDDDLETGSSGMDEDGAPLRLVHARRYRMDEIFVPMYAPPSILHKEWWHKNLRLHKDAYGTSTALVLGLVFMSTLFAGASGGTIAYFSDIERSIGNIFHAGEWADPQDIVLNEFLPNPDDGANGLFFGDDNDSDIPNGEWVELYNNGNVSQDVVGWYVVDASGGAGNTVVISNTNTDTGGTIIPANGWLVVYLQKQILDNPNGDTVNLYTNLDVLVDSYTYSDHDFCENEPTPGNSNNTSTPSGAGSCGPPNPAAPPNKSFARIPDGTGAFVDPIPTPGAPNIPDPQPSPEAPAGTAEPMPTPLMVEEIVIPPAPEEGDVLGETSAPPDEEPLPELSPNSGGGGSSGGGSGGGSPTQESAPPPAQDEEVNEPVPEEAPPEEPAPEATPPAEEASPEESAAPPEEAQEPEPTPELTPTPEPAPAPTPEPDSTSVE